MWQTFCLILEYLERSGKIAVSRDKRIEWVFRGSVSMKARHYEHDIEHHVYIG